MTHVAVIYALLTTIDARNPIVNVVKKNFSLLEVTDSDCQRNLLNLSIHKKQKRHKIVTRIGTQIEFKKP